MFSSQKIWLVASLTMTSACGQMAAQSTKTSEAAPAVDQKSVVPATVAGFVNHEICSGKVTEAWTNPETGKNIREIWERRASFVDFVQTGDNFSVGYKVAVAAQYYIQDEQGNWQTDKSKTYDSYVKFSGVWRQELGRFVGQTHWLASKKNGESLDLSDRTDQKITSFTSEGGKVVIKYVDVFPSLTSNTSPSHLATYDETLSLVDGKLERTWSYKNMDFNRETLEPTTVLDLGAAPSYDTEAKCSM